MRRPLPQAWLFPEASEIRAKLDSIFELIEKMRAVDTRGIVPMAHAQEVVLPLREDVVSEEDRRELYQSVAPAVHPPRESRCAGGNRETGAPEAAHGLRAADRAASARLAGGAGRNPSRGAP